MKPTRILPILAVFLAASCSSPVFADDTGDQAAMQAMQVQLAEMREEIESLREEVKTLQGDLKKALAEVNALKTAQKAAAPQRQRPAMDLLGKPAPAHTFTSAQNAELSLGGKSDHVKVVCFYATWCGYCKRALPGFEKLHNDYKEKGVEVIVVCLDDREGQRGKTPEQVKEHYDGLKLTMPMYMDPQKKIGNDYKVTSYPTSFVLGKDGNIEAVHVGGPTNLDQLIAAELDQLLAGKTLAKQ
jgi:thiol-disulfide isomerase/thioredoxin